MIPTEALCGLLRPGAFPVASVSATGAAGLHLGEVVAATGNPEGPAVGAPGYLWDPRTANN